MAIWTRLWRDLRAAWRPDELHEEIDEEMQFHREMKTAELQARGASPEEAEAAAQRQFGRALRIHEQGYDVRAGGWLAKALRDTRLAARLWQKWPGQTALLISTLALGIGINTAVFSVVNSILLQPLPFPGSSQLVALHQSDQTQAGGVSYPHFLDWQANSKSFTGMGVYSITAATLTGSSEAVRLNGAIVSASLFPVLGIQPLQGRLFLPDEEKFGNGPEGANAVLISDRLWRTQFHQSPEILNKRLLLDGKAFQVVGVLPARLSFPIQNEPLDFWITVAVDADPSVYGGTILTSRGYPRYDAVLARLKPGVSLEQAQAEMDGIAANLAREHPRVTSMNAVFVTSAVEDVVGNARPLLLMLYGGVGCVLLAACANAAGLLLVRTISRGREFAVRLALGAKSSQIIRQLLLENCLVAAVSGLAGVFLARLLVELFVRVAPPDTPRLANIVLDAQVMAYAAGISLLAGLLFGVLPAIGATRTDLVSGLKAGTHRSPGPTRRLHPGTLLIGAQIALSMTLTLAAALLTASFAHLLQAPKGYRPDHVLTASISLPVRDYPQRSGQVIRFYDTLLRQLQQSPGVISASIGQTLPLSGQNNSTSIRIVGLPQSGMPGAQLRFVGPQYFQTLQIPLREGRLFSERDASGHPDCAVVNQAFVKRFLAGQRPTLGTRITLGWGGNNPKEIVGVVGDVRHKALTDSPEPEVYVPHAQFPVNDMAVLLRTASDPVQLAPVLREQVRRLDPSIPLTQVRPLEQYALLSVAPQRFLMWVLVAFALSSLALAAIGLYGALSYSTACRSREFGIRIALGSTAQGLLCLVLRQGVGITLAGILAGLALASLAGQALSRWLYEMSPADPGSFVCAAAVLLLIALLASWRPARRAARVDPVKSLRAE